MTLKLDKRIKDPTKIFDCFHTEEARAYLGRTGYFADTLADFADVTKCLFQILDDVDERSSPFCDGLGHVYWQFFSPAPAEFVRPAETPAEKKWRPRPFTLDEFRAKFPLLSQLTYREKKNSNCYTVCVIGHGCSRNGAMRVNLGGFFYELDNLFNCYELQDKDGNWTPFGVEE